MIRRLIIHQRPVFPFFHLIFGPMQLVNLSSRNRDKVTKSLLVIFLLTGTLLVDSGAAYSSAKQHRYSRLVRKYAPVWVQLIGREPRFDVITRFDFDGNLNGFDNLKNSDQYTLPAVVYGDVVAETEDSYYLFYGVYHVRDYDKSLREFFIASSKHDNDFEGAMLAVDKLSGEVLAVETWFHSKFLQFSYTPQMGGDQTIDGKIYFEDMTHPILLVQALGHGVRAFQKIDEKLLNSQSYQIYRLGTPPSEPAEGVSFFVQYTLLSLGDFALYAAGPFDENSMFAEPQNFGIGPSPIGKYISGRFYGDSSWARPKPPWSWTDKFDVLRPGAWFFHPAYVFNRHFNLHRSERYVYNLPLGKMLNTSQEVLDLWVQEKVPSYFNDIRSGPFHKPVKALRASAYRIAEFLFYLLGE